MNFGLFTHIQQTFTYLTYKLGGALNKPIIILSLIGNNIVLKVWAKKRELQIQNVKKNYIEINWNKIIFFCNLYVHIYIQMKIYLHLHTFHYSSNDTITTNSLLFLNCYPILKVNLWLQSLLIFIQPFLSLLQKYMMYFLSFQIFYQAIIYLMPWSSIYYIWGQMSKLNQNSLL